MIGKILMASLLLCGLSLAQQRQGDMQGGPDGPRPGGPRGDFGQHGPKDGGELYGILPPGRWWKNAEAVKAVGLNDGQIQKIETIFLDSRIKLVDIHASLEKEEIKLEPSLEADNPDENAVFSAIDRIAAARANLEKANAQMVFAIQRVLTPEQWKTLHELRSRREQDRDRLTPPLGSPHDDFQHDGPHPPYADPEPSAQENNPPHESITLADPGMEPGAPPETEGASALPPAPSTGVSVANETADTPSK
jgi:Spy/CpxP family protein refolding chaperone